MDNGQKAVNVAALLSRLIGAFLLVSVGLTACRKETSEISSPTIPPLSSQATQAGGTDASASPPVNSEARLETARQLHEAGTNSAVGVYGHEAEPYFEQAYRIRREILGSNHPDTRATVEQLRDLAFDLEDPEKAARWVAELESIVLATKGDAQEINELIGTEFGVAALHEKKGNAKAADQWERRAMRLEGKSEEEIDREIAQMQAAENQFRADLARMWKEHQPQMNESMRRQLEMAGWIAANPLREYLAKGFDANQEAQMKLIGMSPAQIEDLKRLLREQQQYISDVVEKLYTGSPTNPAAALPPQPDISVNLPASALTNLSRNRIEKVNELRRIQMEQRLAETHLRPPESSNPNDWLKETWDHWNAKFEWGTPVTALLAEKNRSMPLGDVPWAVSTNSDIMATATLNLKGLLLERELRLQHALAASPDPEVQKWRQELIEAHAESIRARGTPIDLASQEQEDRTVAELRRRGLAAGGNPSEAEVKQWRKEQGLPELGTAATWARDWVRHHELVEKQREYRKLALGLSEARRRSMVSVEAVAKALPTDAVLIEYLRFGVDRGGTQPIEEAYGALVLGPGREPIWITLGLASEIDRLMENYLAIVRSSAEDAKTEERLHSVLAQLNEKIWRPLESKFAIQPKRIFISPDGSLHGVSFGGLLRGDKFLSERFDITTLTSGRDLLTSGASLDVPRSVQMWFDPNFSAVLHPPAPVGTADVSSASSLMTVRLDAVGSTRRPAEDLGARAKGAGLNVGMHSGSQATEAALQAVNRPLILHLGTHGFFDPPLARSSPIIFPTPDMDPGLETDLMWNRTGLALAGAQKTLKAWSAQDAVPLGNDGVLTGAEAAQLRLDGTWLVTLAVCDVNAGRGIVNEGILSLKMGFLVAGARHVLGSRWKLDQDYAVEFLDRFYRKAFRSGDPATAFSKVQAEELRRLVSAKSAAPLCRSVRLAGVWELTHRAPSAPIRFQ